MVKRPSIQKRKPQAKRRKKKTSKNCYVTKRICKICKSRQTIKRKRPSSYIIYCIVNSGFFVQKGNVAAAVAKSFMRLYDKVAGNKFKFRTLEQWENAGEHLIVLKGINHKHLRFLAQEMRCTAVDMYGLYHSWGPVNVMIVLSVLGRQEHLDDILDGMPIFN